MKTGRNEWFGEKEAAHFDNKLLELRIKKQYPKASVLGPEMGVVLFRYQRWLLGRGFYNHINFRVTVIIQLEKPFALKMMWVALTLVLWKSRKVLK